MVLKLRWTSAVLSPSRTWIKFQAKDVGSEKLVNYYVRTLTKDRYNDACHLMVHDFFKFEPISRNLGFINDERHAQRMRSYIELSLRQGTALACYNANDEMVAMNPIVVLTKNDDLLNQIRNSPRTPQEDLRFFGKTYLYKDFSVFEKYKVNEYLGCFGLVVSSEYYGRGIGLKMSEARRQMGKELKVKISHVGTTSKFSDRMTERAGYKIDREILYADVAKINPIFDLSKIGHHRMTLKTLIC